MSDRGGGVMGHWTHATGALYVVPRPPEDLLRRAVDILREQEHGNLWGLYWTSKAQVQIVPNANIKNVRRGAWVPSVVPVVKFFTDAGFFVQGRIVWCDEDGEGGTYEP